MREIVGFKWKLVSHIFIQPVICHTVFSTLPQNSMWYDQDTSAC